MKLTEIIEALKAVRDLDTNHRGLLALHRQLSHPRPAADQLLSSFITHSPTFSELHAIWDLQTSGKDLKITLQLLSCVTTLLSYTPTASSTPAVQQQIQHALDQLAGAIIQRRLKSLYFHLSSGNRLRSNAAVSLLTAVASRGGSVLRSLVAAFDFTHSALPKLGRPPKAAAAAASGADATSAAAAAAGEGSSEGEVPDHWANWNSPSLSRRPSRAVFVEWVATMLQTADPLLLPVLLQTRPLMNGLLQHLASDPPGVILGVFKLLNDRVLGPSSAVAVATQLELWGDGALAQLAGIAAFAATPAAAAAAAAAAAGIADTAAAAAALVTEQDGLLDQRLTVPGLDAQQFNDLAGDGSSSEEDDETLDKEPDSDLRSDLTSDHCSDEETLDSEDALQVTAVVQGKQTAQQDKQQPAAHSKQQQAAKQKSSAGTAAAERMQAVTAKAARTAYDMLLLLLTHPTKGLLTAKAAAVLPQAQQQQQEETELPLPEASSSSSSGTAAQLRALRLLQRLQPGRSAAHARLLKAVAAEQPQLASDLLQVLPYNLEPKPCAFWLGCVAVTGLLVAAAARAPSSLKAHVQAAAVALTQCSSSSSALAAAAVLKPPDVSGAAFRAAVRSCMPSALHKGLLSRGLQHSNPLVVSATLTLLQQCMTAAAQLLQPVQQLVAAAAAVHASSQQQQQCGRVLQQRQQQWFEFLMQLRQALRFRAPDISVLVALLTNLQRSAAAAADHDDQQQQQQYSQQQLLLLQCQVCSVLQSYAWWLPEAVADGHVDLAKLLLQGQDLLSAPADVQQAALDVLLAAAAAADSSAAAALPDPSSCSVTQLLPLLKLAVASPAAAVRQKAAALLASRLAPFCGSSSSSSSKSEAYLWLQQLPQIWRVQGLSNTSSSSSSSRSHRQQRLYAKIIFSLVDSGAAAAASGRVNNSHCNSVCYNTEWLSAQLAVLSFVAEAAAAVARKPQEPWEAIQQALQQQQDQSSSCVSAAAAAVGFSSLFAVCAFQRLLRLLKSQKAAASVKAAVCGYVCSVWQQLLQQQQQVQQLPSLLLLLQLLLQEEAAPEWSGSTVAADADAAVVPVAVVKKRKQPDSDSQDVQINTAQQQQQHLLLPPEASSIVSLYNTAAAAALQTAAAAAADTLLPTTKPSSSKKKRKLGAAAAAAAVGAGNTHQLVVHQQLNVQTVPQQQQQCLQKSVRQQLKGLLSATAAVAAAEDVRSEWQQLQLQLLVTPAAVVVSIAGKAIAELANQLLTAAAESGGDLHHDSSSSSSSGTYDLAAYALHLLCAVLSAHGISLADIVAGSSSSSSSVTDHLLRLALLHTQHDSKQQQQQPLLPLPLLIQSSFNCIAQHQQPPAAAAAVASSLLAENADWRHAVIWRLQQAPLQQKHKLVGLVCSNMSRAAAAAGGMSHLTEQQVQLLLVFGCQALQSLMLVDSSSSGSSVYVDLTVLQAVLQHPVLLQSFCQQGSAAAAITNATVMLLLWLLQRAVPTAAAAAEEQIAQLCLPYVLKAVAALQCKVDSLVTAAAAAAVQDVAAVVDACLQLLSCLEGAHSSSSSNGSSSSSRFSFIRSAVTPAVQQLAQSLVAALGSSSSSSINTQKQKQAWQQQQQEAVMPTEAAVAVPAWVQQMLLIVAKLLLTPQQTEQQQQQQDSLNIVLFKYLLQQFMHAPSDAVDAAVAAAIGTQPITAVAAAAVAPPSSQQQQQLVALAAQPDVLSACMQHQPLNAVRAAVAATLLQHNPAELCAAFAAALGPCLHSVAAAAKEDEAAAAAAAQGRREALALLLPAAAVYLQRHQGSSATAAADPVVAAYRSAMLAYMQRKKGKQQQQQQQHSSSSSSSSSLLSAAAMANLTSHAVPVLQLCLQAYALDADSRSKLLHKLLPAAGYPAAGAATVDAGATYEQQLQLAAWLIQQQQQREGAVAAAAAQSDVDMQDATGDNSTEQQQQQQLYHDLAVFVTCACSSLAAIFKHQPWQQQQQQSNVSEFERSGLELQLMQHLNSWAGDLLADLPDLYRSAAQSTQPGGSRSRSETSDDALSDASDDLSSDQDETNSATVTAGRAAFSASLAGVRRLAVPLLQYRFGDDVAVRCLRRLLAALLPGGQEAEQVEEQQQAQQQQQPDEAGHTEVSDGRVHEAAAEAELSEEESFEQQQQHGSGSSSDASSLMSEDGSEHNMQTHGSSSDDGSTRSSSSSEGDTSSEVTSESEQRTAAATAVDHADQAAAAAAEDIESEPLDQPAAAALVSNPDAAAAARQLLQLLVSHSGFVPAVLNHQQQQQQQLPAAVAAVPTPLASYMPVVDAIWSSSSSSNGGSSSEFKHQLVLLLEVLLDMTRFFTAAAEPQLQQQQHDVDPKLLLSLLQLLQVAHTGTLTDSDRTVHRVLLLLDKLTSQQQQQQGADADGSSTDAAAAAAVQSEPLAWPRCLFGQAAKVYYDHQQRQQQGTAAAAAAAVMDDADFKQQLLQELCPLDPIRCALTVVLFPDRRCLNPDSEPAGGESLLQLYHNYSSSSGSSSSGSSSSSTAHVCAGVPASVAASAYDPLALLLLSVGVLHEGLMEAEGFAACGLLGVVLRALAAEDTGLRSLAYQCFELLRSSLQQAPSATPAAAADTPATIQQQLRSSKRSHQLTALLNFIAAGLPQQQQQQIPTAAAVLAAEAALLLAAPAAVMHNTVHKLLLRQPALDTAGLPLLGRILAGSSSSSSSKGGGGGVKGAAAMMAERQWLMRLLWMGLRGPVDARLYRRKYVCETVMALAGSAAANCLNNFTPHMQAMADNSHAHQLQHQAASGDLDHVQGSGSSIVQGFSSSGSSLDGSIIQILRQAVLLPGLASHLIRSSGLLPWLAAAAIAHVHAVCRSGSRTTIVQQQQAMMLASAYPTLAQQQQVQDQLNVIAAAAAAMPGGSWALHCLIQLLSARVALNKRDQAAEIYEAYCNAVMMVVAAVLYTGQAKGHTHRLPAAVWQQVWVMLLLLTEAAPNAGLRKQLFRLHLHQGVLQQLKHIGHGHEKGSSTSAVLQQTMEMVVTHAAASAS